VNKQEYNRNYRKLHNEELRAYKKAWRLRNPEKVKESHRRWFSENGKSWYRKNREKVIAKTKKWQANHSDGVRILQARGNARRGREYMAKWCESNPDKVKMGNVKNQAKRRSYGYNMLNIYFLDSVGHHINNMDVVFIPENVHISCYAGPRKEKHREQIMNYYGDLDNMVNNVPLSAICGG